MLVTPFHEFIILSLLIPQILHWHPLVLLRHGQARIQIVREPRIVGREFAVMNGEGDVDSVRWLGERVHLLFGVGLGVKASDEENEGERAGEFGRGHGRLE